LPEPATSMHPIRLLLHRFALHAEGDGYGPGDTVDVIVRRDGAGRWTPVVPGRRGG